MRQISTISTRSFVALVSSLLVLFQPVLGAQDAVAVASASPFLSASPAEPGPELIAVAKLSGTADRNGEPLVNGSIIASGDSLRTSGNSGLLLASTPEERLWLGPNTNVKLSKDGATVSVAMARGTVTFRSRGHVQITVENHDGVALRSSSGNPVLAQVSLVGNQQAQVRVQEGLVELVEGGRTMLLQPERDARLSTLAAKHLDEPAAKTTSDQEQPGTTATTGAISGTVVDAGLFVVADANVTLTGTSGKPFTAVTGQDGKFSFLNVQPGSYTLHVTKSGFKPYELKDVAVRSGSESSLFVHLGGGGGTSSATSNKTLLWVLVGGAGAAVAIGAAVASSSGSHNTSPSTVQ
ncbi:MAG: carboxypeptidase-like regulatory domain-containing protein [Candidatus Acidiferrum sp.]